MSSSSVRVRRAVTARHLAAVRLLQKQIFTAEECVCTEGREWWLVWDGDKAVGFAGIKVMEDFAFMCLSGILPSYRGNGLQKRLIKARESFAKRCGLSEVITYTLITNPASSNNLIKRGYRLYEPQYAWQGRWVLYWSRSL